jgi:hypothetical protein
MYLGSPGFMIQIPDPQPGVKMTADRGGSTHTTLQGGQRVDYPGKHPRTFSLSWTDLNDDQYALLEKTYLRQFGPGPFVFIPEPARWNYMSSEQSSGAETGNVSGVTPSAGTVVSDTAQSHSGARSYKWTTTATASTIFVNNAPNNAQPLGIASPASAQWCFSAWVRTDTASQQFIAQINWFDATGAYKGTSSGAGATINPAANTWTQAYAQGTVPSGGVFGVCQIVHVTAAIVNVWIDEQMMEFNKAAPGTHLAGRGQPLVSFTEFSEQYDWAIYGGVTGKHSADGTFVEVN